MHKFSLNRISLSLLLPAVLIVAIILSVFYSIEFAIFRQQLVFLVISLVAYFVFLNIDYRVFAAQSKIVYGVMIALLLILFFIGIEARGAVRWIDIFGIRIQFSEVIKPFFIIFMAQYLAKDEKRTFGKFIFSFVLLAPIFFLVLKQPDLGNAMIFLIVLVFMLFSYGFPIRYFLACLVVVLIPMPFVWNLLHEYQRQRVLTFLNPSADPFGASYNVVQSLIAVGSGGFFGKGFGHSTQSTLNFLPEHHTDFIFATMSEALGFAGSAVLISLYIFLLYKLWRVALEARDEFSRLTVLGFFFLLLTHAFLNIGMNLGIVPIVGITLPFASYGGSSLLTFFIILGIASSIKFDSRKRGTIEIK